MTKQNLIDAVVHTPTEDRHTLLSRLRRLADEQGLDAALQALFRQQVATGFVLFDPATHRDSRLLEDPTSDARFIVQWNPDRRLRLDHDLLIERGIVRQTDEPLINPDARGIPCYLCRHNIERQNPGEVLFGLELAYQTFYAGANFAPIGSDHFTIMSAEHTPQRYHRSLLEAALQLLDRTRGRFRVLYNGRAGASIEAHLHLHATTTELPVERVQAPAEEVGDGVVLRRPQYPTPLWILESAAADALAAAGDSLLRRWHAIDPEHHTENLLLSRDGGRYRLFVYPRDRRRRTAPGRKGALASFELSGLIAVPHAQARALYESVQARDIHALLEGVTPEAQLHWP